MSKWTKRSREYAETHMNISLSALNYNMRVVPVLGYIAQLHPPPDIQAKERAALHHLTHLPTNTWDRHMFHHLEQLGGVSFVSVDHYCAATALRTAMKTIADWKKKLHDIQFYAEEFLGVSLVASGSLCDPWWDTVQCFQSQGNILWPC